MQADSAASQFALDVQGLQRLKQGAREQDPEALRAAAQQFEALFLHALVKGMRATVPTSDLTNSQQTEFYQSLLDHQWAQTMAERGIGLADQLVEQLESSYQLPAADGGQQAQGSNASSGEAVDLLAGIPRGVPRQLETPVRPKESSAAGAAPSNADDTGSGNRKTGQMTNIDPPMVAADSPPSGGLLAAGNLGKLVGESSAESFLAAWGGQSEGRLIDRAQGSSSGALVDAWSEESAGLLDAWKDSTGGLLDGWSTPAIHSGQVTLADPSGAQAEHIQIFLSQLAAPAQAASQRTGVPAELILAQAALETGWGRHQIVTADGQNSHNLFGIKAGSRWQGPTTAITTHEYIDGQRARIRDSFRVYESYEAAFTDYGRLISNQPRYAAVGAAPSAEQAARELQAGGYATDPAYADKLIKIMGRFGPVVAEAKSAPGPLIEGF